MGKDRKKCDDFYAKGSTPFCHYIENLEICNMEVLNSYMVAVRHSSFLGLHYTSSNLQNCKITDYNESCCACLHDLFKFTTVYMRRQKQFKYATIILKAVIINILWRTMWTKTLYKIV